MRLTFLHELSIEKYLSAVAVIITGVVGLIFLLALLIISLNTALDDARERGRSIADLLAFNLQAPLAFGDTESADVILESLTLLTDVSGAELLDSDGNQFSLWGGPIEAEADHYLFIPTRDTVKSDVSIDGENLGTLSISISLRAIHEEHIFISVIALGLWIVGLFIAIGLSRSLNRRVTTPLNELDQFMTRAAQTESYSERVNYSQNDELGHVVAALNNLLDRVEDRDNRLSELIEVLTEARDAAEASAQAKTSFLANMSHEVRTPMNGIVGLIDLIKLEGLNRRQEAWIASMGRSADALLTIIDDILDFTRIEAGQLEIRPSTFALEPCVTGIRDLFTDQIKRRSIAFNVEISDNVPALIHADQGRIRQILLNLVGNAFKFTEEGSIAVKVCIKEDGDNPRVHFEVIDTGIGIAEAQHEVVFARFQQIDTGLTRRYGGAGLGLSICHQLATLMGGEIGFESAVNQGSRFWFEIPLTSTSVLETETQKSDPAASAESNFVPASFEHTGMSTFSVLVAEDSEVNQFIVRELLNKLGVSVTVVADGQQAVDAAATTDFDVILMDISMPIKDGLEATQEIIANATKVSRDVYIVGLSAHAMVGDKEKAIDVGMRDYLTKPISLEALREALARYQECQNAETIGGKTHETHNP